MSLPAVVHTEAFKRWFGNSKIVDSRGNPLIVYKGMNPHDYTKETPDSPGPLLETINRPWSFPSFDPNDQEPVFLAGFFSDDPNVANRFVFGRSGIYPVFLKIEKPKIFDAAGKRAGLIQFGKEGKPFRDAVRSGKYDGIIIMNTEDEGNVFIPLSPNQIKSALCCRDFNPSDPRFTS